MGKVPGAKTDQKSCLKRIRVSCENELSDMTDHGCPAETMNVIKDVLKKKRDLLYKLKGKGGSDDPYVIFKRIISDDDDPATDATDNLSLPPVTPDLLITTSTQS